MTHIKFIIWCLRNKSRIIRVKNIWEDGIPHCEDCLKETINHFSIKDELWYSFCKKDTYICLDCFEQRIGRKVCYDDLKNCQANEHLLKLLVP